MNFNFNSIVYSEFENWDEFIQITFVGNNGEYLSLSSVLYEEEIYTEFSDQINYLQFSKTKFEFYRDSNSIFFVISQILKGNNEASVPLIATSLSEYDSDYLLNALSVLKSYKEE